MPVNRLTDRLIGKEIISRFMAKNTRLIEFIPYELAYEEK